MPLIQIHMLEGRPEGKIKELIENVTEVVADTLNAPKESIRILITEIPKTHWGIAGIPASDFTKTSTGS